MNFWLVKSEPYKYSWDDFVAQEQGVWDGVRNYQARNNLMAMQLGDKVLFYHSNEGKEIVGLAEVSGEHYPDPTTDDSRWVVVNLKPIQKFQKPVTLETIKAHPELTEMALLKQSRLSVAPVRLAEFELILRLSHENS